MLEDARNPLNNGSSTEPAELHYIPLSNFEVLMLEAQVTLLLLLLIQVHLMIIIIMMMMMMMMTITTITVLFFFFLLFIKKLKRDTLEVLERYF